MNILITGANGFIGKNLIKKLSIIKKYNLSTITRKSFIYKNEKNFNFSLSDIDSLKNTIAKTNPDIIINLAATGVKPGETNIENLFQINSYTSYNMLLICKNLSIKPKFIFISSGFEYKSLDTPIRESDITSPSGNYGISKVLQTMLVKQFENDFSMYILRFFGVFGAGENINRLIPYIISKGFKGEDVNLTKGEQIRDFMYVDDAVEALLLIIKKTKKTGLNILNISTGKPITLKKIVNIVQNEILNYDVKLNINYGALKYRNNEPMIYTANTTKMKKYLNWQPETGLEEGVKKTIEYVKNEIEK